MLVGFFSLQFHDECRTQFHHIFCCRGEVFPTSIRATGAGFAAAFAKAGAVLGTFVLPIMQTSWGVPPMLIGLSVCCVVAAGLTAIFRIETTGQSLEAVQALELKLEADSQEMSLS